jgi:polyisoprenoid-binding protein YceI
MTGVSDTRHSQPELWEKNVKKITVLLIMIIALVLAGCGSGSTANDSSGGTTDVGAPTSGDGLAGEPDEPTPQPTTDGGTTGESQPATEAPVTTNEAVSSGGLTFALVSGTEARFYVNEVLNGAPKEVIGITSAVEGSLMPDFANPANTTIAPIRIDLSTLETDSGMRNRAMRDRILQTSNPDYQYATFTPKSLVGMPATITIGTPFTFQIVGDLTLHGVTKEETFDVTATAVSETRIEGSGRLNDILYADYGIAILSLPMQVASVEDTVDLELAFVAEAQ